MRNRNTNKFMASLLIGAGLLLISGASYAGGARVTSLKFDITAYKRGDILHSLPRKYEVIDKCGRDFYYFDGVYVREAGDDYVVVWARRFSPDFKRYTATAVVIPGGSR